MRIWTSAPSRRPWTAASSISPMISRSTQSTAARVANGAPENAPPTAILVLPCSHAPCLDTGVPGDAAACSSFSARWRPHRRAARLAGHSAPGTHSLHVLGEPKGTPLVVGNRRRAARVSSGPCRAPPPGGAGRSASPGRTAGHRGRTVIVATTNGGTSWTAQHVTGGSTPQLSGISCPTATDCMAVGSTGASVPGSGVVVTTSDGGTTWSPADGAGGRPRGDERACAPIRPTARPS